MSWHQFDGGKSIGKRGSEQGTNVRAKSTAGSQV